MNTTKRRLQLNNQGVTLVELLVAIAILAVIVGPFLHAFVSSMRTNMKARDTLRATTVAQDITEGIKAYSVEQLCSQFDFPAKGFKVVNQGVIHDKANDVTELLNQGGSYVKADPTVRPADHMLATTPHAGVYSADGGDNWEFLGQPDGKYYFSLSNIKFQHGTYDALVTLDANPYRAGGSAGVSPNAVPVISIDTMDASRDGFFIQEKGSDKAILAQMTDIAEAAGDSVVEAGVDRTITIEITKKEEEGKEVTKATVSYNYAGQILADATKEPVVIDQKNQMFSNIETGETLRNLYLCYYPLYNTWKSDTIVIKNDEGIPVNISLIKQMDLSLPVQALESTYRMNLKLFESANPSLDDSVTRFATNLDYNMMVGPDNKISQTTFSYNGIIYNFDKAKVSNLTNSKEKDRLYDITVKVYEEGAAADFFESETPIVVFDGSKQD